MEFFQYHNGAICYVDLNKTKKQVLVHGHELSLIN